MSEQKKEVETQKLTEVEIRLKAIEYAHIPGLGVDLEQAEKIYHFILSGELKSE